MRSISLAGAGATCAVALALAGSAAAKPVPVDLHVEGADGATTAARYLTDTTSVSTQENRGCGGSGDRRRLPGKTALGALVDAGRVNQLVAPVGVSDQFDFGLFVCGIGGDYGNGESSFWLYRVNHVAAQVGSESFKVRRGDDVLWYLSDTARNRNTGDELELVAPARARTGQQFSVTVYAYDLAGVRTPAAGVRVTGGTTPVTTDASGAAAVTVAEDGDARLRASLAPNIPDAPVKVCVAASLSDCPAERVDKLYGSRRAERIRGTRGRDVVAAAGGRDVVLVRGGGADFVSCGGGRDFVRAGRLDTVQRDCEVVRLRGRT